ncbi:hypothetical protein FLGE108171_02935 [Flavobacterium gelidilacus]|jgi:hypothetical protein
MKNKYKFILIFNITSLLLIIYSLYLFLLLKPGESFYYAVLTISIVLFLFSLLLLFLDYLLNKFIRDKFLKNGIEIIFLIIITFITYKIL